MCIRLGGAFFCTVSQKLSLFAMSAKESIDRIFSTMMMSKSWTEFEKYRFDVKFVF